MAVTAGVDSIEHGLFLTGDDLVELGRYRGAWVPTVATMEGLVELLGADSSGGRLIAGGLDRLRELLPEARKLGVTVLAGSDLSYAHGAIAGEAIRLAAYGMDAEDAVWALTAAAREYLGLPAGLHAGYPADAVFLAADPRYDLGTLGSPALVMRRGNVVPGPGR
jgi:imidazolonepropionase-like amidohydrolase